MQDGERAYRLASAEIVSDVIDGETVMVDLASGSYYTANATGGLIWSLLTGGWTREEVIAKVAGLFQGESASVRAGCEGFINRLRSEGLICVADDLAAAPPRGAPAGPAAPPVDLPPFVEPALVKYTDMEDLLSLDPIHEVDELGWPHVKPSGARYSRADD